jgi:putative redox protein
LAAPAVDLELVWQEGMRFEGREGDVHIVLDGGRAAGPSPTQALAFGLAGCMAIDVVQILTRGRQPLSGLRARLTGLRADAEPRRYTSFELRFAVAGDVEPEKVERALALSREKYCSVWHSLRQDIELRTSFELVPA